MSSADPARLTITPRAAELLQLVVARGGSPEVTGDLAQDLWLLERLGDWAAVHVPTRREPLAIITPNFRWSEHIARERGLGSDRSPRRRWLHVGDNRATHGFTPSFYYVESSLDHVLRPGQHETLQMMRAMGWRSIVDGS